MTAWKHFNNTLTVFVYNIRITKVVLELMIVHDTIKTSGIPDSCDTCWVFKAFHVPLLATS